MADRVVKAVLTGSSAGAVKAFEETALAAEGTGKRASAAMAEHSSKMSESVSSAGSKVSGILGGLAVGELAVGGAVAYAAKVFGDQQAAMASLNTALADAGTKWTPQLHDQFDKVSDSLVKVGFDTSDTANSISKMVAAVAAEADRAGVAKSSATDSAGPISRTLEHTEHRARTPGPGTLAGSATHRGSWRRSLPGPRT